MEAYIANYGYLAVTVGTFFGGESVLMASGALAHAGLLSLPLVIICASCASITWDQVWFYGGWYFGRRVLAMRPAWQDQSKSIQAWLSRYGSAFVVIYRFMAGFGTVSPLLLGAGGFPRLRFLLLSGAGATVWGTAYGTIGWSVGASVQHLLGSLTTLQQCVIGIGAVLLVTFLLVRATGAISRRKRLPDVTIQKSTSA
jgi:membrane protein DedA with SNARE-associated domain